MATNPVTVTAVPFNQQAQSFTPAPVANDLKSFNQSMVAPIAPTEVPRVQELGTIGTQKINLPTQQVADSTPAFVNQAEQFLTQTAVADTEAQKASQSLSKGILELIPQLQGQTQALQAEERVQGLPLMRQNLQNISNQILQKQAELNQDEIRLAQSVQNIEDKPIAMEFITGQQQSVQRNAQIARALKASEIGVLNATAIGMQGNIQLAQDTARQAVELKYAPYKEAIETYKLQLEALTPILNADEKKQAREQTIKTNLAMKDIEKREKREEVNNSMLIKAMAQGAPTSITSKAEQLAKAGASESEVASVLGIYAGDVLDRQIKQAQLAKLGLDIRKTNQELAGVGEGLRNLTLEEFTKFNSTPQAKGVRDATTYGKAVRNYKAAIEKYGTGQLLGQGKGALNEAYSSLVGATKDYYTLGTYDNGVQKLIALGIPEPSVLAQAVPFSQTARISALDSALKTAKDKIETDANQLLKSRYANSEELATLLDGAADLLVQEQTLDDLLTNLPSQAPGAGNADFFGGKTNTTTKAF